MTDYKLLARNAKKIDGERRFVVDWAYNINKPTRCEICGDIVCNGHYTRAWFEISRQVYPDCIGGNRKGITICNKHARRTTSDYLFEFFNKKIVSDVRLKGCTTWNVVNAYEDHDKGKLEKIVNNELNGFREFVLQNINKRYGECSKERLNINRRVVDEIEKQYENAISDRDFKGITDLELKKRLEDIEDMLLSTVKKSKKQCKSNRSLTKWRERVGEYVQDLAVSRFLYNGEISNSSYFRKRLIKYAGKWSEKKFVEVHKVVKEQRLKNQEKETLKYKVKLVNTLSESLKSDIIKLSDLVAEINEIMERKDA